jgi:eukaryotic translation initiation factor 2C
MQCPHFLCFVSTSDPANSFVVKLRDLNQCLYQYDVEVKPEAPPARIRAIFAHWRELYLSELCPISKTTGKPMASDSVACCFDGKRTMTTSVLLNMPSPETLYEVGLPMPSRQLTTKRRPSDRAFQIKVKYCSSMSLADLDKYLNGEISKEHSVFSYTSSIGKATHGIFTF